ncbi:MAG: sigma-70 family RNA polymerase sigma factor [Acidimicrobiales bacterium]
MRQTGVKERNILARPTRADDRSADEDIVRLYLNDIGRHQLLTKDDEFELGARVQAGMTARERLEDPSGLTAAEKARLRRQVREGEAATTRFVQANLRLVVSIAKKYQSSGLPLLDLVQEGNLGLMHAVEKFDARKGFKFSTYATWWIRQAITRGIANSGATIRLPVHAGDLLKLYDKSRAQLEVRLQRRPTLAEIAEEMGHPVERVAEIVAAARVTASLDEAVRDDGDATLADLRAVADDCTDETAIAATAHGSVQQVLAAALDEREQRVLTLRYGLDRGEPRTLEEVGEAFGLTRERIRQIEARALSKLRHPASAAAGLAELAS